MDSVRARLHVLGPGSHITTNNGSPVVVFNNVTTEVLAQWLGDMKQHTDARVSDMDISDTEPPAGSLQTWSGTAVLVPM